MIERNETAFKGKMVFRRSLNSESFPQDPQGFRVVLLPLMWCVGCGLGPQEQGQGKRGSWEMRSRH